MATLIVLRQRSYLLDAGLSQHEAMQRYRELEREAKEGYVKDRDHVVAAARYADDGMLLEAFGHVGDTHMDL